MVVMDTKALINYLEAIINNAQAALNVLKADNMHRIPIAWMGQNTSATTDDYSNSDCGPACVAMWLNWLGHTVTVDDVSAATGLTRGYKYTLPTHLITAASHWSVVLARAITFTPSAIKAEIDR